jgi:hypothetical protein
MESTGRHRRSDQVMSVEIAVNEWTQPQVHAGALYGIVEVRDSRSGSVVRFEGTPEALLTLIEELDELSVELRSAIKRREAAEAVAREVLDA